MTPPSSQTGLNEQKDTDLAKAETDPRFENFKFMGMLDLASYISRCRLYISEQGEDAEVQEFLDAAVLIRNSRIGAES